MKYFEDITFTSMGIIPEYHFNVRNYHPSHYSLELLASGAMYFQELPGKVLTIDYPALRWQAPGHTYNYGPADERGWEHYFIIFHGPRAERLYRDGFSRLSGNCFIPVMRVDWFRGMFLKLNELLFARTRPEPGRALLCLEEILLAAEDETTEPESFLQYTDRLERLCTAIKEEPQIEFDLRQTAASLGLSYSHFRKLFRQYTGIAPHQYILRARIATAENQLRTTSATLKEIAFGLNLGDMAQFSKTFSSVYGMAPGMYRRNFRNTPL